jgi:diguanylate cyclase (GGDEF)-like protein
VITGIDVPLELAALLCAGIGAVGMWAGNMRAKRRLDPRLNPRRNPLGDLMQPEALAQAVDLAARREALRAGSHAVLHGRIDQLAMMRTIWNADTRAEVREHVAAVMRAGLRRGDSMALAEGDGFTIVIPGADERAAVHIADRLRRTLTQLLLPQLGGVARLTASFGVASDRFGETGEELGQRARRALDQAVANGTDHVVPASEIEEIMLLPAPAPSPAASAA